MTFIPVSDVSSASSERGNRTDKQHLPPWFRVKIQSGPEYQKIRCIVDTLNLHTICEEARCPNVWECWNNRTATFLILGDICTRRCQYCAVTTGRPLALDEDEPGRVAKAIQALALRHAVITSVNRDDLSDGGASVFAQTIRHIRETTPTCTVEVLIPDFQGSASALREVIAEHPEIVNHNIETVPRLFPLIRPQGKYHRSIQLLERAKSFGATTKSGFIVGLGETLKEIEEVMQDLRRVDCDILTIGQYLQPTTEHAPVTRYYTPDEFKSLRNKGLAMAFRHVEAGPLVRSSYHADQQTARISD